MATATDDEKFFSRRILEFNSKGLPGLVAFHNGWYFVQFKSPLKERLKLFLAQSGLTRDGNFTKKMYDKNDLFIMVSAPVIQKFEGWWDEEIKRIKSASRA
eukprot:TRINITY_DN1666_c0_g2_i1.p1 TRINITY_DN1666_c0_g2~~TRINITY_DN1666_c0_g2_i1.p1  ORF type:complete len:101 (+),score=25.77 TRINITY_DN1666_c0_g2_i1:300-602(+)